MGLLSLTFLSPVLGALLLFALPRRRSWLFHAVGGGGALVSWVSSVVLFATFRPDGERFQFVERIPWIPSYGVSYHVGVDGISLVLILLTTTLSGLALVATIGVIRERVRELVASLLLLEGAMIGTFASLDLFLFYVLWEAMLIPMYLIIGVWGGPRRVYATLKFFLYTMAGSVLMLVGVLALYSFHREQTGVASTALLDLYRIQLPLETQAALFVLFAVAFAIKIPVVPFHTWLPDAHVEAPTAGSVILAAVLLKMGGYGFLRLAIPIFPEAAVLSAPFLAWAGVIGIVYGALTAWAQEDLKKLVAYSSVSHMGFVVLGIAALTQASTTGAVFQMISHGVSTGALFLLVGVLYERRHTRMLGDFGGLAKVTPRLATVFLVISLASIGLPGLCGFVGEFLVLTGSFGSTVLGHPGWMVGGAVTGVILGAAYMLGMYERIFLGGVTFEENRTLPDLSWREGVLLLVPVILAVVLGLQPGWVLARIEGSVAAVLSSIPGGVP